jgi:hypothetical protein
VLGQGSVVAGISWNTSASKEFGHKHSATNDVMQPVVNLI